MEPLEPGEPRDLRAYARVLRERRWTVLAVPFVLLILALLATLKQQPVYRATTLLEIEKENPNILTVQDLFELENVSDTYLETQYKVLRSETLARRVIDELSLARRKEFNPPRSFWHRSSAADPADAAASAAGWSKLASNRATRSWRPGR
jgi:succinoglycan biosynthesis transport protein ExoP